MSETTITPEEEKEKRDRISELPDQLLLHILSLLPTADTKSTFRLSKRWRSLWGCIPILDFGLHDWCGNKLKSRRIPCISQLDSTKLFLKFNKSSQKFRLICDHQYDLTRVYSWLSKIVQNQIIHLTLTTTLLTPHLKNLVIPFSLKDLKLSLSCTKYFDFKFPDSASFPNLKSLSIQYVTFSDNYYSTLDQLLSRCPILNKLELYDCKWENINNNIHISAPELRFLICHKQAWQRYTLRISAPKLQHLTFNGHLPKDVDFVSNLLFLEGASIHLFHVDIKRAIKFLGRLSGVFDLTISNNIVQVLFQDENFLPNLPTFNNLESLELTSGLLGWPNTVISTLKLSNLLHTLPTLTYLTLNEGHRMRYNSSSVTRLPECLLSRLKNVEINIRAHGALDMIEFFLKNARVLKRMTITGLYRYSNEVAGIKEQILKMEKCSKACYIYMQHNSKVPSE